MTNRNNRSFYVLFLLLFFPTLLLGQSKNDKTVVGKVGKQKVTYAELKENFNSGNRTGSATLKDLEEFLPIYLDYKAKLLAAKDQGYYQDSTLLEEHTTYVKQAAYAHWLEQEIKPAAFDEYKKRADLELKTFHILIAVNEEAPQDEVDEVIAKLKQAKQEMENGVDLEQVNQKYSSTQRGRSMGGAIPWISAGRTVVEYEDVAYNLEVGEISEPFKTQFGYHIVLLQDKRPRTPARLVNHIFVRDTPDSTAYDKIHEAYEELENGKVWNQVLNAYTEDGASKRNNGRIGWVSYQANFAPDFVDAIVQQDPALPYSAPAKTPYGYHIFKIDSVETYASEEERDKTLRNNLNNSPYYKESNQFAVDYLKDRFNASTETASLAAYEKWLAGFDSTAISDLSVPERILNNTVFTFNGKKYSVKDYQQYLGDNYGRRYAAEYRRDWFDDFTQFAVDSHVIELTMKQFPEFEKQSENYLNGLVVYNINDDNVWSAATVDSTKLRAIYEANISEYQYPERPYYYLLTARHDSVLTQAQAFANDGVELDSLKKHVERLGVSSDSTTSFTEEPFDRLAEMKEQSFSEHFDYNKLRGVFWLEDRLPARRMTFEEAFNRLLSKYQPEREQAWLEELRRTYKIKADQKKLKKAFEKDS